MGDGGEGGGVRTDWGARLGGLVRDVSYLSVIKCTDFSWKF